MTQRGPRSWLRLGYSGIGCAVDHNRRPERIVSCRLYKAGEAVMAYNRSSALKYIGEEYSGFWAAAEKVAAFIAICLLTLLLICIESHFGIEPPSPAQGELLFH
jgi:hypothetical protein